MTTIVEIRECILQLRQECSLREIEKRLSMHRTIIRKVRDLVLQKEWLSTNVPMLSPKNRSAPSFAKGSVALNFLFIQKFSR